jgi:hypothetical protein
MPLKRRTLKSCPNIGAITGILLKLSSHIATNVLRLDSIFFVLGVSGELIPYLYLLLVLNSTKVTFLLCFGNAGLGIKKQVGICSFFNSSIDNSARDKSKKGCPGMNFLARAFLHQRVKFMVFVHPLWSLVLTGELCVCLDTNW